MVARVMPLFYIFIILISLPLNALALVTFTCRIREKKPAVIYMRLSDLEERKESHMLVWLLVITLVSYSTIIYVLSVKSDHLATSSLSSDKQRSAVIMAIAVLSEFVVCFAPTNGILLYLCFLLATGFSSVKGDSLYATYLLAVCLGSASVFLDPPLYYYGSSQCRKQIRSVFRRNKPEKTTSSTNTDKIHIPH